MESTDPGVGAAAGCLSTTPGPVGLSPDEWALFEELYAEHSNEAARLARGFLADPELAADAVQSAYLQILRSLSTRQHPHEPAVARSMVLRNTRWASLKALRTRRRRPERPLHAHAGADDLSAWAESEARAVCSQIVARLRPEERLALRLRFIEGLSHPDAARLLGISTDAFKSRLRRSLEAARRVARGVDLLGGAAWCLQARMRRGARRLRGRITWPGAGMLVKAAAVAAAVACVVPAADRLTTSVPLAFSGVRLPVARSTEPLSAASETIASVVFLDAVAVESRVHPVTVLALGRGRRCACPVLARSMDAGRTWALAPGPGRLAPGAHLDVSGSYPADPRIVVRPGSTVGPTLVSARFGDGFAEAAAARLAPGGSAERAGRCVGPSTATRPRAGLALAVAGNLLSFPTAGGVVLLIGEQPGERSACNAPG